MAAARKYLTKSLYKQACECPVKLFYTKKPEEYSDQSLNDPFLKALAEGGFQVGELAKLMFPGGKEVKTLGYEDSLRETKALLDSSDEAIFEAAVSYENLFVRVDVLKKTGDQIKLIEVKSKSFDPNEENPFYHKKVAKNGKRKITAEWQPYLADVAFQTYVVRKAFPNTRVTPYLMMADKSKTATVDGLNQMFLLAKDPSTGRTRVRVSPDAGGDSIGSPILCKVDVSEAVDLIFSQDDFEASIKLWAKTFVEGRKLSTSVGSKCKQCQYKGGGELSLKSGLKECWSDAAKRPIDPEKDNLVSEIWNFRKTDLMLASGIFLAREVSESDINPIPSEKNLGLSMTERQWLQIQCIQGKQEKIYIDLPALEHEMKSWVYPFHLIDFETSMAAIPFNAGRRPYEQLAFQFSHHILYEDGSIEHVGEYLHDRKGEFPNFHFLRALKEELSKDQGTIFRYAPHENTVLCQIYDQLGASKEKDADELRAWIKTVTRSPEKHWETWRGDRDMVDLCDLVKRYYYSPLMKGSNSIKKVLPAILEDSKYLQTKYGAPIYGSEKLRSRNFENWAWIKKDATGKPSDPYKQLPPIFDDIDVSQINLIAESDNLADGGAAMTAYARMQFTEMSELEFKALRGALLRYCELDTLAMVLIVEYFLDEVRRGSKERAA